MPLWLTTFQKSIQLFYYHLSVKRGCFFITDTKCPFVNVYNKLDPGIFFLMYLHKNRLNSGAPTLTNKPPTCVLSAVMLPVGQRFFAGVRSVLLVGVDPLVVPGASQEHRPKQQSLHIWPTSQSLNYLIERKKKVQWGEDAYRWCHFPRGLRTERKFHWRLEAGSLNYAVYDEHEIFISSFIVCICFILLILKV